MEVLGGFASIVAAIQISDRVLILCGKYVLGIKAAKGDIERFEREVKVIQDVLK